MKSWKKNCFIYTFMSNRYLFNVSIIQLCKFLSHRNFTDKFPSCIHRQKRIAQICKELQERATLLTLPHDNTCHSYHVSIRLSFRRYLSVTFVSSSEEEQFYYAVGVSVCLWRKWVCTFFYAAAIYIAPCTYTTLEIQITVVRERLRIYSCLYTMLDTTYCVKCCYKFVCAVRVPHCVCVADVRNERAGNVPWLWHQPVHCATSSTCP